MYQILPRDFQSRFLIRNYNSPYTDFAAYWEALAVREPFSDSFVDQTELQDYTSLQRLASGDTPDWNMVAGIPAINGYTTLLPQAVNRVWSADPAKVGINNLPEIKLTQPELKTWAVKYYLIDYSYPIKDNFAGMHKVAQTGWWAVYELPGALSRVRWAETEQAAPITNWTENPNVLHFTVNNPTTGAAPLIIADRFDPNWQATVDNQVVPLTNVAEQRQLLIPAGSHVVELTFVPHRLYQGAWVSGITLVLALSLLVCLTKKR